LEGIYCSPIGNKTAVYAGTDLVTHTRDAPAVSYLENPTVSDACAVRRDQAQRDTKPEGNAVAFKIGIAQKTVRQGRKE